MLLTLKYYPCIVFYIIIIIYIMSIEAQGRSSGKGEHFLKFPYFVFDLFSFRRHIVVRLHNIII